jgi:cytochrome c-type biogenesis protein CcmE
MRTRLALTVAVIAAVIAGTLAWKGAPIGNSTDQIGTSHVPAYRKSLLTRQPVLVGEMTDRYSRWPIVQNETRFALHDVVAGAAVEVGYAGVLPPYLRNGDLVALRGDWRADGTFGIAPDGLLLCNCSCTCRPTAGRSTSPCSRDAVGH